MDLLRKNRYGMLQGSDCSLRAEISGEVRRMIEIHSTIQHCLGQEEAIARIHQMVATLTQRFPQQVHQVNLHMKDHRVDVSFAAYGYLVSWRAEVYDDQVSLLGLIPESAKKFQGKMEQAVVSRLEMTLQTSIPKAA